MLAPWDMEWSNFFISLDVWNHSFFFLSGVLSSNDAQRVPADSGEFHRYSETEAGVGTKWCAGHWTEERWISGVGSSPRRQSRLVLGRCYQGWANVRPTYIAVWGWSLKTTVNNFCVEWSVLSHLMSNSSLHSQGLPAMETLMFWFFWA